MSRSPLHSHLQRLLEVARWAARRGIPVSEALERRDAALWLSRRDLLTAGTIAGAGLLAGCGWVRRLLPSRPVSEVAVVGAGIAGLTCAYRLHQAGVPVRVYEAQQRVGGRIWSLPGRFPAGQVCELGGELIDTGHEALRGLAEELALELDDFQQDDASLASDLWYFDGRRVADAEVVEAFTPLAGKIDEAWESVTGETISFREPSGGEAIDRQSIAEWLESAGCEGFLRELLDVAYTTEFGLDIAEQSAWNLLSMIDTEPDPFRVFGESDERFHVRGGNDQIPTRLATRLAGRIESGVRLEAIRERSDRGFTLAFARGAGSFEVGAERVVLAIPFTMLREVAVGVALPAVKRRAIDELGYGTNAKLMIGFAHRLWRRPQGREAGSNGSVCTDLPFQLVWETTRMQPGESGILTCFTGGRRGVESGEGPAASQAERVVHELERIFPGIAGERLGEVRFHWPTFELTRGSYACYKVGQWTGIGGVEGERAGNLHFAGEHTSVDFQGFMEGGCESGERVAREILEDLGLAEPAAQSA